MEKMNNNSFKKIIFRLLILSMFVYFSIATFFALFNVLSSYANLVEKDAIYNSLVNKNISLNRQIVYHNTDAYVEKVAREDFMMKREKDSVVYLSKTERELPIVKEIVPPVQDTEKGLADSILQEMNLIISFLKDKINYVKEVFILHH